MAEIIAAKPVVLTFEKWQKAARARKPKPDQTRLLAVWSKIEEMLVEAWIDDVIDSFESNEELLHITLEDGQVWLTVLQHRTFNVTLNDLSDDVDQLAIVKETIHKLAAKKGSKRTS